LKHMSVHALSLLAWFLKVEPLWWVKLNINWWWVPQFSLNLQVWILL
jgi:hypothetical protein